MTGLLPADRSRAILVGCGTYDHLTDLPAVANNVNDLAEALSDPLVWGLPPANCTVISGDVSISSVIDAVRDGARAVGPDGLLLIYYAGHGMIDSDDGRLHLAVTRSEVGEEDTTAVAYESIRRRVWPSRAAHKLVVLDCCYAGRAMVGEMSTGDLAEDIEIDQSVIIAAANRNLVALAPPGARNTAFTGALLNVINQGVVDGPPVLGARTIYREVLRDQAAKRLPRPEFRQRNATDDLPLVRNAWQPPALEPPPTVPPGPLPERRNRVAADHRQIHTPSPPATEPATPATMRYRALAGASAVVVVMVGAAFAAPHLLNGQTDTPARTSAAPVVVTTAPSTPRCTGSQYAGWTATGKQLTIHVGPFGTRYQETDELKTTVAVENGSGADITDLALTAYDDKNHKIATKGWPTDYRKQSTTSVQLRILPRIAVRNVRLELSRPGERMNCAAQIAAPQPSPKPTSITGSWNKSGSGMRLTVERVSRKTVQAMPDAGKPGLEIAFAFKNTQANDIIAVEIEVSDHAGYELYRSGLPVFQNIGTGQTRRALVEFPVAGKPESLMVSYSGVRSGMYGGPTSTFTFRVPAPEGA